MAGTKHRDRGALIALGMALAAIVLAAWLSGPYGESVADISDQKPSAESGNGQPFAKRVYWGLFTADDTIAQWLMAVFTAAATGFSFAAVILLNRTLAANKDAANAATAANKIMRQEGRPWIKFSTAANGKFVEMGREGVEIEFKNTINNIGKRPAINSIVHSKIIRTSIPKAYNSAVSEFVDEIFRRGKHKRHGTVRFPDDETDYITHSMQKFLDGNPPPPENDDDGPFVIVCITYRDIDEDLYFHNAQIYQPVRSASKEHTHGWHFLRIGEAQSIS